MAALFKQAGFDIQLIRSIRGIGYQQEQGILEVEEKNPAFFNKIMEILNETATDLPIVETCGHAIIVAEKR